MIKLSIKSKDKSSSSLLIQNMNIWGQDTNISKTLVKTNGSVGDCRGKERVSLMVLHLSQKIEKLPPGIYSLPPNAIPIKITPAVVFQNNNRL